MLVSALRDHIAGDSSAENFKSIVSENLLPEFETVKNHTDLAQRAILEYFESVLSFAYDHSFTEEATTEFFKCIKGLLHAYQQNSEIDISTYLSQEVTQVVSSLEEQSTSVAIIQFIKASFLQHQRLWHKFFHEDREINHISDTRTVHETPATQTMSLALPENLKKLPEVLTYIDYVEPVPAEPVLDENGEPEQVTDDRPEEVKKLCSFGLKFSKDELREQIMAELPVEDIDNYAVDLKIDQFYAELEGLVADKLKQLNETV